MNADRFSAQLRQHLLDTADERPASGQLASVVGGVAATPQRHPLVARWTWFPGRVGPFPSAAMRYGLIAAALVGATVAALIIGGSSRPPSTVFEGTWTSIDTLDRSTQFLIVGAGNAPIVQYVDELATGGACVADAIKRFTADGTGTIVGNQMSTSFPNGGGCGSMLVEVRGDDLAYNATTDRIVGTEFTWTRVPGGAGPTLRPRATGPSASIAPATLAPEFQACSDIPAGETYRGSVGPLSLTVTIPSAAAFEWDGYRHDFNVSGNCWLGGPVDIHASIVNVVHAACEADASVEVDTPAEAVAALADARGFAISEPTSATLGGYAATRFEIPSDAQMCFGEVRLWNDATVARGMTTVVYVVDVNGLPLGFTIYNWGAEAPSAQLAEAESILASLQVVHDEPVGPIPTGSAVTPPPDDGCTQFDDGGTYTAPSGSMSLTVTIPDAPDTYWHGLRDEFHIQRAPCLLGSPLSIEASVVLDVYGDACLQSGTAVDVASAAEAAAALVAQAGSDATEATSLTIDGNPAVRLEVSVPEDFNMDQCEGGAPALWLTSGGPVYNIYPGSTWTVYLVDFGGSILAVTASRDAVAETETPTLRQEIDAIVGSLEINAVDGGSN